LGRRATGQSAEQGVQKGAARQAPFLVSIRFANPLRFFLPPVKMQYVAAYLLLVAGGNAAPSAADITSLLSTVE